MKYNLPADRANSGINILVSRLTADHVELLEQQELISSYNSEADGAQNQGHCVLLSHGHCCCF